MRNQKMIILCIAAMMAVGAFAVLLNTNGDNSVSADPVPEGYISISTPQELALIGKNASYPLDGKYWLANDIVFTSADDTNGGISVGISSVVSGTDLVVTLTPSSGSVTSFYAWIGISSADSSNNMVTLSDIPLGVCTLTVGGMADSYPFAYSVEIETSTPGEKTTEVMFNSNGNFDSIGTFTGTFDGNCHEIKGVSVSSYLSSVSYSAYAGLFGYAPAAQIYNLGVVDSSVTAISIWGQSYAGGIVGYVLPSSALTIENCFNAGSVTAISIWNQSYAGGIVGYARKDATLTIENCYNAGSVAAIGEYLESYAGGIVGFVSAEAYSSPSTLTVENCYNTGNISATLMSTSSYCAYAGGIAGFIFACAHSSSSTLTIENCYNTGSIKATATEYADSYAGGMAGYARARPYALAPLQLSSTLTIENCYNIGSVVATADYSKSCAGGTVGYAHTEAYESPSSLRIENCHNVGNITAIGLYDTSAGGIAGYTNADLSLSTLMIENCYNTGNVVAIGEYTISAGGIAGYAYTLSSTQIMENCYNTGSVTAKSISNPSYAGGIVGYAYAYSLPSVLTINNCYNTGSVTAVTTEYDRACAGGIAGCCASVSATVVIENCYNTGSVTSTATGDYYGSAYAGGIVGCTDEYPSLSTLMIENCYNTGSVTSTATGDYYECAYTGGIVGYAYANEMLMINNCYNTGSVTAATTKCDNAYTGGIAGCAGSFLSSTIENCYFIEGQITLNNSQSADVLEGSSSGVIIFDGGMLRENDQGSGAKTASQMAPSLEDARNSNSIYYVGSGGWDFFNVWGIDSAINDGYPYLRTAQGNTEETFNVSINTVSPGSKTGQARYSLDDGISWSSWDTQAHIMNITYGTYISVEVQIEDPCLFSYWSSVTTFHNVSWWNYASSVYPLLHQEVNGDMEITFYFTNDYPKCLTFASVPLGFGSADVVIEGRENKAFVHSGQFISLSAGTDVTMTATGWIEGYHFSHWVSDYYEGMDPISNPTKKTQSFTMDGNKEVTAVCEVTSLPSGISTADELYLLAKYVNEGWISGGNFYLLNNLDLNSVSQEYKDEMDWSGKGWTPIGGEYSYLPFNGIFDGRGYKITGLWTDRDGQYAGLFGQVYNSTIKDLYVEAEWVCGGYNTGVLVGLAYDSTVEGCYVQGKIANSVQAGGLIGQALYSSIKDSHSSVLITAGVNVESWQYVGGLIGDAYEVTIEGCSAASEINVPAITDYRAFFSIGGLIGNAAVVTISECTATMEIDITTYAKDFMNFRIGGLIGYAWKTMINDCSAVLETDISITTQNWNATFDVGGLIGDADDAIVDGCYALATMDIRLIDDNETGAVINAGGLVGRIWNGSVTGSHSSAIITIDTPRDASVGGLIGSAGEIDISECHSIVSMYIYATDSPDSTYWKNFFAGGLLGYCSSSTVTNSESHGCISVVRTNGSIYIGGFGGSLSGEINGCCSSVEINIDNAEGGSLYVGGFVGSINGYSLHSLDLGWEYFSTMVSECYSVGCIAIKRTDADYSGGSAFNIDSVGGFAGILLANVTDCYTLSDIMFDAEGVAVDENMGKLIEYLYGIPAVIARIGGFTGTFDSDTRFNTVFENSFAVGKMTAEGNVWIGGFIGMTAEGEGFFGNYYLQNGYDGIGLLFIPDMNHNGIDDRTEEWWDEHTNGILSGVDTDGDGFSDIIEIAFGSDPNNPNSIPLDINGNGIIDALDDGYTILPYEVPSKVGVDEDGVETLTEYEITQSSTFTGWDMDYVWGIYEGYGSPYLRTFENNILVAPMSISGGKDYQIVNGNENYDPEHPLQLILKTENEKKVVDRSAESVGYYQISVLNDGPYTITTSAVGGNITPTASVSGGGNWTVSFSPLSGYILVYVKVDGVELSGPEASLGYYMFYNVSMNHTVAAVFAPMIEFWSDYSGGTSVEIEGIVHPLVGATYVKVYITFSDGSVISSMFSVGPTGEFSFGYSGSMQPVSYLVTAFDGKPGMSGSNMVAWTMTISI